MALNVLMLSTLFPDMSRPNFGVFVERQARELASRDGVSVTVVAPVGLPPWPLSRAAHYAALRALLVVVQAQLMGVVDRGARRHQQICGVRIPRIVRCGGSAVTGAASKRAPAGSTIQA